MPELWIASTYPSANDRNDYVDRHALVGVTSGLSGFEAFYAKRRGQLLEKIRAVVNPPLAVTLNAPGV